MILTANASPWWAVIGLLVGCFLLLMAMIAVGDDHERPVPRPPRVDDLPPVAARLRDESVAWDETSRADRKARLIDGAEIARALHLTPDTVRQHTATTQYFVLGRRERDAEALIDRIFPDPTIPKGER